MAAATAPVLVTPLKDICVKVVATEFERRPSLGALPDAYVRKVVENLPLDLPLELVGTLIQDETYWRRRANARWKNLQVAAHGNSWKQLYFERNLQDVLEQFDLATSDVRHLKRLLSYSRRYVQTLHVRQLPSHLDLQIIFDCMGTSPAGLILTYGMKNVGMDYDRSLFGMKLSDCRSIARALERTETLTSLDVSSNMLDDDRVRMIASGLVDNLSVTNLDLSHNKVADRGIRSLAKLLANKSVIAILDLHDNLIHAEGGRALARGLKHNECLVSLSLRLNRLGDEGCKAVCDAVRGNTTLQRLNLSANAAGMQTAASIASLLTTNQVLFELDISCNSFGADAGSQIRAALDESVGISLLDVRNSGLRPEDELAIIEELNMRKEKKERGKTLQV